MNPMQQKVREFHAKFGFIAPERPQIPSDDQKGVFVRNVDEESLELRQAVDEAAEALIRPILRNKRYTDDKPQALAEVAREIADLLYVTLGVAIAYGIDIEPIFDEVHRANMSKDPNYRDENGKIKKPRMFRPPRVKPIVEWQMQADAE